MNGIRILAVVLLVLLGATAFACSKPVDTAGGAAEEKSGLVNKVSKDSKSDSVSPDKVVVYYFHGTRRCQTCLGIQKNIEDTIKDRFAKEVAAGTLVFKELNFEEEENKGYVEKYQLSFSTMIVTAQVGEEVVKWENAGKLWDYANAPEDMKAYVDKSVSAYLKLLSAS